MRAIIKFAIYLLYAIILATCIYNTPKIKIESRNIAINHTDSLFSIRIENISNYSCAFQFKLNGNFFSNINEIKQSIQELDYLNPVSEIESFIHSHLTHSHAEIKNAWRYEPLLLLNSSGKGECGDFASLFYYLSHFLEIKSAIVSLQNHQINGFRVNDELFLIDVYNRIHFKNLIPFKETAIFDSTKFLPFITTYNPYYWMYFKNISVNRPHIEARVINNTISLPPKSSFTFPIHISNNLEENLNKTYACAEIMKGITGNVRIPLIPLKIEGAGKIKIDNKFFTLPSQSDSLNTYLKDRENYSQNIEILKNHNIIKIYYFINPKYGAIKKSNQLTIKSNHLKAIKVSSPNLNYKYYSFSLDSLNYLLPTINKQIHITKLLNYNNKIICKNWNDLKNQAKIFNLINDTNNFNCKIALLNNKSNFFKKPRIFNQETLIAYCKFIENSNHSSLEKFIFYLHLN